jgi:hypothetical protein
MVAGRPRRHFPERTKGSSSNDDDDDDDDGDGNTHHAFRTGTCTLSALVLVARSRCCRNSSSSSSSSSSLRRSSFFPIVVVTLIVAIVAWNLYFSTLQLSEFTRTSTTTATATTEASMMMMMMTMSSRSSSSSVVADADADAGTEENSSSSSSWNETLWPLLRGPEEIGLLYGSGSNATDDDHDIDHDIDNDNGTYYYYKHYYKHQYQQEWNRIHQNAFRITNTSFCLDWSISSDLWWTHHPEWQVAEETMRYYCYRYNTKNRNRAAFMKRLYDNQFHGDCIIIDNNNNNNNNNNNQLSIKMWSSGWKADLSQLEVGLHVALHLNMSLQLNEYPWHYAAPDAVDTKSNPHTRSEPACHGMNFDCYFLPLSNCPKWDADTYHTPMNWMYPKPPKPKNKLDKKNTNNTNTRKEIIIPKMTHKMLVWERQYLVRPYTWLRRDIHRMVQHFTIQTPCTAMHVRRGDVILHDNYARKYHAISEYLDIDNDNNNNSNSNSNKSFHIHDNILLLTDDANAISEAQTLFPDKNWMYIERPRWRADQGGWEHQLPSSKPIFEMTVLQATFQLVKRCDSLIRTQSGFGEWLEYHVLPNAKIHNLDQHATREEVHSRENVGTRNVSVDYHDTTASSAYSSSSSSSLGMRNKG